MNDIDTISRELPDRVSRLLIPLQTRKVIDQAAFEGLEQCARSLARKLKGSELVRIHRVDDQLQASVSGGRGQ